MTADGQLAGICVTYDGNELNRLRQAFIQEALRSLGETLAAWTMKRRRANSMWTVSLWTVVIGVAA